MKMVKILPRKNQTLRRVCCGDDDYEIMQILK